MISDDGGGGGAGSRVGQMDPQELSQGDCSPHSPPGHLLVDVGTACPGDVCHDCTEVPPKSPQRHVVRSRGPAELGPGSRHRRTKRAVRSSFLSPESESVPL